MTNRPDDIKKAIRAELNRSKAIQRNHRNRMCLRDIVTERDFLKFYSKLEFLSLFGEVAIHEHIEDQWTIWVELLPAE